MSKNLGNFRFWFRTMYLKQETKLVIFGSPIDGYLNSRIAYTNQEESWQWNINEKSGTLSPELLGSLAPIACITW